MQGQWFTFAVELKATRVLAGHVAMIPLFYYPPLLLVFFSFCVLFYMLFCVFSYWVSFFWISLLSFRLVFWFLL